MKPTRRESDAYMDCVDRLKKLKPAEQENVIVLLFYWWVYFVIGKVKRL